MNASRVDQPRTSPVAFLTKTARSAASPAATVAIELLLLVLAAGQNEVLDLLLAVEIDDDPEQLTLFVRAAGVDAERVAEAVRPPRLVDVTVQGEPRLIALDHLPHGLRADRDGGAARVLERHVLGQLRRLVEPGVVGRAVQVEDR